MSKRKKKLKNQKQKRKLPKALSFAISINSLTLANKSKAPKADATYVPSHSPNSLVVGNCSATIEASSVLAGKPPLVSSSGIPLVKALVPACASPLVHLPGIITIPQNLALEPDIRTSAKDLPVNEFPYEASNLRSWAVVAKGIYVVKEIGSPLKHVSSVLFILIPEENIESGKVQFKDYVHACFRGHSPDISQIIGIVNAIWAKSGPKIFVHKLSANCFLLKVIKPKICEILMSRNVWNIAGQPMFVSPWLSDFESDPGPLTKAKVMVEFRGVPFLLFNDESLSRLATPIGKPIAFAPKTAKRENFEVAKVVLEVDLLKKLPTSLVSGFPNGKEFKIDITYPWLPPKCSTCDEFGHDEIHCLKNLKPEISLAHSNMHQGRRQGACLEAALEVQPDSPWVIIGDFNQIQRIQHH